MDGHLENAVPAVPNIVVNTYRPNYTRPMRRIQTFKQELMPTGEQQRRMRRFAGSRRVVFNEALSLQK